MIKHCNQKQFGEEMAYLTYISQVKSSKGRQGRNLESRIEEEAMEECYFMACSVLLFYIPQAHLFREHTI